MAKYPIQSDRGTPSCKVGGWDFWESKRFHHGPGEFEIEQFFHLSPAEITTVKTRLGNEMQLGLCLDSRFLRMSRRALNSTDLIHWRILAFLNVTFCTNVPLPPITTLTAFIARSPVPHQRNAPEPPPPRLLRLITTLGGRIVVGCSRPRSPLEHQFANHKNVEELKSLVQSKR